MPSSVAQYRKSSGEYYNQTQKYLGDDICQARTNGIARTPSDPVAHARAHLMLSGLLWIANAANAERLSSDVHVREVPRGNGSTSTTSRHGLGVPGQRGTSSGRADLPTRQGARGRYPESSPSRVRADATLESACPFVHELPRLTDDPRRADGILASSVRCAAHVQKNAAAQTWCEKAFDWISRTDPLRLPAADAKNLDGQRNPRERFWRQRLQGQVGADIYSNVEIKRADQAAESNAVPPIAGPKMAREIGLLTRLVDKHALSTLQRARACSTMQRLREDGELNGTLEACRYQQGQFIDEILDHRGRVTGMVLSSCASPGQPDLPSIEIVGVPASIAELLLHYYDASATARMRMDNDLRASVGLPPVGISLNIDEAWRAIQADLYRLTIPSTELPMVVAAPSAASIVLHDRDTGIHRAIQLEILGEDKVWYPLEYIGGDSFTTAVPGAPSNVVTLDSETGQARFVKGLDDHYEGSFDVQIREEGPYVLNGGISYPFRRVCLGNPCFFNYPEVFGTDTVGQGNEHCPVYANPISRTWHPLIHNDGIAYRKPEVDMLERIAEWPRRDVVYGRPAHVDLNVGPLFAVSKPGHGDPFGQYTVVEMLGMLVPARPRLSGSNATEYEVYDRNDLLGACYPVKWDGLRWVVGLEQFVKACTARLDS